MLGWAPGTGAVGTASHPFSLDVNGRDLIDFVPLDSIAVTLPGPGENGSMDFVVFDNSSSLLIVEWDHVRFTEHAAARPVTFGGFVQSVETTPWAAGGRTHVVRCWGYGVLLDRRRIDSFRSSAVGEPIGQLIQALIANYGQVITAQAYDGLATLHTYNGDVTKTVLVNSEWSTWSATSIATQSLRAAIEQWGGLGYDTRATVTTSSPVPFIYWVDSYARLHAFWLPADAPDDSFEDDASNVTDSSNAPQGEVTLEGDAADYATSVYVDGGAPGSSPGWVRRAGHPVAGDIEDGLSIDGAVQFDAASRDVLGSQNLELRAGSLLVATIPRVSSTPLDLRPGMTFLWTTTQLGLSTTRMRITGVSIRYLGASNREYRIQVGGRLKGSLARDQGRYQVRLGT